MCECVTGLTHVLLRCRKNRRCGSVLRRGCWCSKASSKVVNCVLPVAWCEHVLDLYPKAFCPVHHLAPLIKNIPEGTLLFKGVTPAAALANLRKILVELNVPNAMAYRTHDLRRGHARDLQINGACTPLLLVLSVQALLHVGQVRRCTRFSQQENGGPLPSWRCGLSLRVAGA